MTTVAAQNRAASTPASSSQDEAPGAFHTFLQRVDVGIPALFRRVDRGHLGRASRRRETTEKAATE